VSKCEGAFSLPRSSEPGFDGGLVLMLHGVRGSLDGILELLRTTFKLTLAALSPKTEVSGESIST
jgi:hypothetical protein